MVALYGPKLEIQFWEALFAPGGPPEDVIRTLNAALEDAVVTDPAILMKWEAEGVSPYPHDRHSPAAGRAMLAREIARWGAVIRDNHMQLGNE